MSVQCAREWRAAGNKQGSKEQGCSKGGQSLVSWARAHLASHSWCFSPVQVQRAGLDFSSSQGATKVRKATSRLAMAMLRGQVEANPPWGVFRTSTKLY